MTTFGVNKEYVFSSAAEQTIKKLKWKLVRTPSGDFSKTSEQIK